MRRQRMGSAKAPKAAVKVAVPGAAPSVGAAPAPLRSSNPALTIGAPSTRNYGKSPPALPGPPRGFGGM